MPSRLHAPTLASQETELGPEAEAVTKPRAAARRRTWKEGVAEGEKKMRRAQQVVLQKQPHAEVGVAEADSALDLQLRRSMSLSEP
jgi:hypothetical protein